VLEATTESTALLTQNSTITGGRGGELPFCLIPPYRGGAGGTGLVVGPLTAATGLDSVLVGGPGGVVTGCAGTTGPPGAPLVNDGGFVGSVTGPHLGFRTPTVGREGQVITLRFRGTPGDRVFLIEGSETTARLLGGSTLVVKPSHLVRRLPQFPLGTIQPNGLLDVPYTLPAVAAGATNVWLQGYTVHDGRTRMGGFSVVTVLDSIY
jgi:hypothetical protein